MSEISIPDGLIEKIAAGRVALVVGSNIGALAELPSWKVLLERFRDEIRERGDEGDEAAADDVSSLFKKGRLISAARFLARKLGGERCDAILSELWQTPEPIPESLTVLGRIPIKAVWTVHPSDLVERAIQAGSPEAWPVPQAATYDNVGTIDPRRRYVLKMLGDMNQADSYVVLPKNVRRALASRDDYRSILQELYTQGTLLFVGFRHGDPDLHAILDKVFGSFEAPENEHYFVSPGLSPVDIDDLSEEHELTVVPLVGEGGDAEPLLAFLTELAEQCEAAELSLAVTRPDDDDLGAWLALLAEDPQDTDTLDAVQKIEDKAREDGDSEKLIEVILARVEYGETSSERAKALREMAHIYEEQVGDLPHAFTALTAAMRENPADEDIVADAERLAGETDGFGELVAALSELVPTMDDKDIAAAHWTRLGGWYADKLRHDDYAIASYREAIKLDNARTDARSGLQALYRKQQKWGDLAEEIEAHLAIEDNNDRKVDLCLELGEIHETQLASTNKAIEAYEKAIAADGSNEDALGTLERLYRRDERWGKLGNVLEKRAEMLDETDPSRAAKYRKELASLRSDKLGDLEGAITRYESALEANASDTEALRELEKLYEKVGRVDDYFSVLERLAEIGAEGDRASLWRRLAVELEDRDGSAGKAAECYEKVLELDPSAVDVYRSLDRLLRKQENWDAVADLLERHIGAVSVPAQRLELYLSLGSLFEVQMKDNDRAIEANINVLDIDGDHVGALSALGKLYQVIESWDQAVVTMVRLAEKQGADGTELWFEAGQILAKHVGDMNGAEERFVKALELSPSHVSAMKALTEVYKERDDWAKAVQIMLEAEKHTQNRLEKIQLLFDAANAQEQHLEQGEQAVVLYSRVLSLDPEHLDAAGRVAENWLEKGRWSEVAPVLDTLARKTEDKLEKARWEGLVGKVAATLGDDDKARKYLQLAHESDREAIEPAFGLAELLFKAEEWDAVDKLYREILARHRSSLNDEQLVDLWYRIGVSGRERAQHKSSEDAFRRALEIDATHEPSLDALVEVAKARGDWMAIIEAKQRFVDRSPEEERVGGLVDIGDIHLLSRKDTQKALAAYLEALQVDPDSRFVLHKLLDVYSEQEKWDDAVDTLAKIAELEKDSVTKAKYFYATAVICRDELNDKAEALTHFTTAMQENSAAVPKAFPAIEKILTEEQSWKELQRAYRRMIKSLGDDATEDQLIKLWSSLAKVNHHKLGDRESAIMAYEVAITIDPGNIEQHEELANLYIEAGGDYADKAVTELQVLVKRYPDRLDLYRSLATIYGETGQPDKVHCMVAAMTILGQSTEEEKERFNSMRPKEFKVAAHKLTEELWQKAIIHPREDRALNGIFASLMASLAANTAASHSDFGLDPQSKANPDDPHLVARVFRYVAHTLGIEPRPELYLNENSSEGIRTANIAEHGALTPAVLIGAPHIKKQSQSELAFDVGKKLSFFRPERYVFYALPDLAGLTRAFGAALKASGNANGAATTADLDKLAGHIQETVPESILDHVSSLVAKLDSREGEPAVKAWLTATDLTADRAGLILCNDLEIAARVVATEQGILSTLSAKDRLRELLVFGVSEEYFQVRRHLGLEISNISN